MPFPSPGDLPDLRIEPGSSALQADSLPSEPPGKPIHTTGIPFITIIFKVFFLTSFLTLKHKVSYSSLSLEYLR